MSFVNDANEIRGRIPFAYWLVYDAILAPFLVWGFVSMSHWFAIPLLALVFSAFFDINEALVKWSMR